MHGADTRHRVGEDDQCDLYSSHLQNFSAFLTFLDSFNTNVNDFTVCDFIRLESMCYLLC